MTVLSAGCLTVAIGVIADGGGDALAQSETSGAIAKGESANDGTSGGTTTGPSQFRDFRRLPASAPAATATTPADATLQQELEAARTEAERARAELARARQDAETKIVALEQRIRELAADAEAAGSSQSSQASSGAQALGQKLEAARAELRDALSRISDLERELRSAEETANRAVEERDTSQKRAEQHARTHATDLKKLETELGKAMAAREKLLEQISEQENELSAARQALAEQVANAARELEASTLKADAAGRELNTLQQDHSATLSELDAARKSLAEFQASAQRKAQDAAAKMDGLNERASTLARDLADAESKRAAQDQEIAALREARDNMVADLSAVQRQIDEQAANHLASLQAAKEKLDQALTEIATAQKDRDAERERAEALEAQIASHASELAALESDLAASIAQRDAAVAERDALRLTVTTLEQSTSGASAVATGQTGNISNPPVGQMAAMNAVPAGKTQTNNSAAPSLAPGTMFSDCDTCPQLVVVPPGRFTIGSPESESGRRASEGPRQEINLAVPFALGRTEITRAQWQAFAAATNYGTPSCDFSGRGNWREPGFEQGDDHPVVCINFADAQSYISWLNETTDGGYRLPSEAEWEYAARAMNSPDGGATDKGEAAASALCEIANLAGRESSLGSTTSSCADGFVHTAAAASLKPNGFALHDMQGNALEWVADCWHDDLSGLPDDGSARGQGEDCLKRVLRGGAWRHREADLRIARRHNLWARDRFSYIGFRVAKTLR